MYKVIRIIILFMLVANKTAASINDTIYHEHKEELSYDTIPYMVKDKVFLEGLDELKKMLVGEKPYSLKRAEFIVEWAYSGGNMDYSKFCHDIDSVAFILKRFIEVNNIQQYKTAPNYALFEYFTKPNPMNGNKAFSYDFDDFAGENDFRKLFITKVKRDWGVLDILSTTSIAKQFVGSYSFDSYTASNKNQLLNIIYDTKNFRSLFYHLPGTESLNHSRNSIVKPFSTTYQFYIWKSRK